MGRLMGGSARCSRLVSAVCDRRNGMEWRGGGEAENVVEWSGRKADESRSESDFPPGRGGSVPLLGAE